MNTISDSTSLSDVLSGKAPIKVAVSIDPASAGFLALALFAGIALALILYKKI